MRSINPEISAKIAEVVEASTTNFIAQCYELYELPPLGSLVKTADKEAGMEIYGVVGNAATTSIEPGRRPIARGRDEASEEAIFRSSPHLLKLFKSEFSALVVGYRQGDRCYQYLPPQPARIHGFVYRCTPEEVTTFSQSFDFLTILLNTRLAVPADELVAAALRLMSQAHQDHHTFLVAAGKELATLLGGDFDQLKSILGRLK